MRSYPPSTRCTRDSAYAGGVLRVEGLDHVVLIVADVERSVAWYRDRLGLEVMRLDEWRNGKAPFPSVRVNGGTIIDILEGPRSGTNVDHFCLVLAPTDLAALAGSAEFDVVDGPVQRWGARGEGTSVYVRDPDDNLVELRHYGGS
jgi:catechol 2,3-dioxygenase-like lactoylglutathione lyase family enzyme